MKLIGKAIVDFYSFKTYRVKCNYLLQLCCLVLAPDAWQTLKFPKVIRVHLTDFIFLINSQRD